MNQDNQKENKIAYLTPHLEQSLCVYLKDTNGDIQSKGTYNTMANTKEILEGKVKHMNKTYLNGRIQIDRPREELIHEYYIRRGVDCKIVIAFGKRTIYIF